MDELKREIQQLLMKAVFVPQEKQTYILENLDNLSERKLGMILTVLKANQKWQKNEIVELLKNDPTAAAKFKNAAKNGMKKVRETKEEISKEGDDKVLFEAEKELEVFFGE